MKTLTLTVVLSLTALSGTIAAKAQDPDSERIIHEMRIDAPHPHISPERKAQMVTERMDSLLGLDKKQYKKLYKINLKEARRQAENAESSPFRMGGQPGKGGHPGEGGGRPPRGNGMAPGGPGGHGGPGGGRPPRDFGGNVGGPQHERGISREDMEKLKQKEAKEREKTEKKIKKILTADQYERWRNANARTPRDAAPAKDSHDKV
ncbi:MAG: hypothetical protein K2N66_07440 [Paramuribaculum sp.]|nr:hypothetical protein [Paramuribaculum sp.]